MYSDKMERPNRQKLGRPYSFLRDGQAPGVWYIRGRYGKKHRSKTECDNTRRSANKRTRQFLRELMIEELAETVKAE